MFKTLVWITATGKVFVPDDCLPRSARIDAESCVVQLVAFDKLMGSMGREKE